MTALMIAEQNDAKAMLAAKREDFETHRTEADGRNRGIKAFSSRLSEFFANMKSNLTQMIADFDAQESKRRQKLGTLLPAGDVKESEFGSLADKFTNDCMALMDKLSRYWLDKSAKQVQDHAYKLEAYLANSAELKLKIIQSQLDAILMYDSGI